MTTGGAKGGTTAASGGVAGGTTGNTGGATGGAKGGTTAASGGAAGASTGNSGGASGGSSSGGATGGAGGQSTVGSCNVEPVTPNATPQTRKVLCYLYQIYGNHILSAQEENNDDVQLNYIFQTTGKKPAIRAFDMNNSKAPGQCVEHWNNGGLCMFGYHMGIAGSYSTKTDIEQVLTEGSSYNTTFKSRLDTYAGAFQQLAAVNGVGIVRLLHEAGKNCAWFWWGMGTADQYLRLYKYAFNYLTVTKGLKNTIWMVPLCGSGVDPAYNPGTSFADLGGSDTYVAAGNYGPLTDQFNKTVAAFPGLPIALHENGPIPDPDQMKAAGAKWLMFNTWCDQFPEPPSNSVEHLKAVYTHEYVITLDEMPNLK
jgi:Beta-mannanase